MDSQQRREARYQRRQAKRTANRAERLKDCTIENVASINNLYVCAMDASKGVRWKASVQRYMAHVLKNVIKARDDLLNGRDIRRGSVHFDIFERGKLRHITAVRYFERVIQKSFSANVLIPGLAPTLTEGCTANIKGRGTHYAVNRLKQQLVRHYRKYGNSGYILQIDFADYFASINHDVAKELVCKATYDKTVKKYLFSQIDSNGEVGLGLGSEPNQALAVAVPNQIDHAILRMRGIEASGRYMDDTYLIAQDKQLLWQALLEIETMAKRLHLRLNKKKTRLVKLSHGFVFLKRKFNYSPTGQVIVRPCRASVARARRRMRGHARLVAKGEMSFEDAWLSYRSLRGSWKHMRAHKSVVSLDALWCQLFNTTERTANARQ